MQLIARIGISGANGHVIEYCGEAVRAMSMEQRMTVCNMSIECGARAGLMAPDQTTLNYLRDRRFAPTDQDWERAAAGWLSLASDPGAAFDRQTVLDVGALEPMVTWGTNPEQAVPVSARVPRISEMPETHRAVARQSLEYTRLAEGAAIAGTPVDWAFVGSCTNGRIEDLRIAARIVAGRRISPGVTFYVVPGSEAVHAQAVKEGLDRIFTAAGAEFRQPGCSLCLAMNDDRVPAGKRCIRASNRNFIGRQGTGSITHLASPATVAASALEGCIASAEKYL